MIVGSIPEVDRISRQLQQQPLIVQNLFEAIGEITVAPASSPIVTVVMSESCLSRGAQLANSSRPAPHVIEAIRKIDPSVRVVLVLRSIDNAPDFADQGFDECVALPLTPADVLGIFDEDLLAVERNGLPGETAVNFARIDETPQPPNQAKSGMRVIELQAGDDPAPQSVPQPKQANPPIIEIVDSSVDGEVEPGSPIQSLLESGREPIDAHAKSHVSTHGLGDTDLVEAILSGRANFAAIAVQLIVQQTGWNDITLDLPANVANADHSSIAADFRPPTVENHEVEVCYQNRQFGRLVTRHAGKRELQPWADWLARWLAMDATHREYRIKAFQDDLTGAWNRRYFDSFLAHAIEQAARLRRPISVMVFDVDNFKSYNDQFGHDAGDEILQETVKLLTSVIRQGDRVCRIGGDEFAVVFADFEPPRAPARGAKHTGGTTSGASSDSASASSSAVGGHIDSVEIIARRFQHQVCAMKFPKLGEQARGSLSISAGLATFPWDGNDPASLLRRADQLALESKRKGKNAITFGPGAAQLRKPK